MTSYMLCTVRREDAHLTWLDGGALEVADEALK